MTSLTLEYSPSSDNLKLQAVTALSGDLGGLQEALPPVLPSATPTFPVNIEDVEVGGLARKARAKVSEPAYQPENDEAVISNASLLENTLGQD